VVVARLLSKVAPAVSLPLLGTDVKTEAPPPPAAIEGESEVKQIVTAPVEPEKPAKRKLRQSAGSETNELTFSIGKPEGKD
jgi:hypothetical protein